jgi:hypothetical protein
VDTLVTLSATGAFSSADVGKLVFLDSLTPRVPVKITAYSDANTVTGRLERNLPGGAQAVPEWSLGATTITGLTHLIGQTVAVLADGVVHPERVVDSSGNITLQYAAAVVQVGLPILAAFETLALAVPSYSAESIRANKKLVRQVFLEVQNTAGLWVGDPGATLDQRKPQDLTIDAQTGLETGTIKFLPPSAWNIGGRVRVEQRNPLPAHVLSLEPELFVGSP